MTSLRGRLSLAAWLFLGAGAIVWLAVLDPATVPWFPRCLFLAATGWECPGCGTQRALHDLAHLHLRDALAHNALAVLFLPGVAYTALREGASRFTGGTLPRVHVPAAAIYTLAAAVVLFAVARNLTSYIP